MDENTPPTLNVVQLEYHLLTALQQYLGTAIVSRDRGDTQFGFLLNNNKRAIIEVSVRDILYCSLCNKEIEFPGYKQETHYVCVEAKNKSKEEGEMLQASTYN